MNIPRSGSRVVALSAGAVVLGAMLSACGTGARTAPTAPSAQATSSASVVTIGATAPPTGVVTTWSCFTGADGILASAACGAARIFRPTQGAVAGMSAPNTPTGLASSLSGTALTLTWQPPASGDAPSSYVIEAGASSGATNVASFDTGNAATTFTTGGVAAGAYYIRVRARNSVGTSAPSNEILLTVGTVTCNTAPGVPSGLGSTVSGSSVTLTWTAPAGGCTPTSYAIEAGSSSGAGNLANVQTGTTATSFLATGVGSGTYFVRVRAANNVGASAASNEVVITVGTTAISLTGRWVGLAPDGLVFDPASGSCDSAQDIQLDLVQTGSIVTGTMTGRVTGVFRAGCDTIGFTSSAPVTGTAAAGVLSFTTPGDRGRVIGFAGTFTATRIAATTLGATLTVSRQ